MPDAAVLEAGLKNPGADDNSCMEFNLQTETFGTWSDSLDHNGVEWFEQVLHGAPGPLLEALQRLAFALAMVELELGFSRESTWSELKSEFNLTNMPVCL